MNLLLLLPELLTCIINKMNLQTLINFSLVCKFTYKITKPNITNIMKVVKLLQKNLKKYTDISPIIPHLEDESFFLHPRVYLIQNLIKCARDNNWITLLKFQTYFPNFMNDIHPLFYTKCWPSDVIKTKSSFDNCMCHFNKSTYKRGGRFIAYPNVHFYHVILSFFIPTFNNHPLPPPLIHTKITDERKKLINRLLKSNKKLRCDHNLEDAVKRGDYQAVECLLSLGVKSSKALEILIIKDEVHQRIQRYKHLNIKEWIGSFGSFLPIIKTYYLYRILFDDDEKQLELAFSYDYHEYLSGITYFNFKYYDLTEKSVYFQILQTFLQKSTLLEWDFDKCITTSLLFKNKRCYDLLMTYKN